MFYINTITREYPITEGEIRALHKNTSFATPFLPVEPYALVKDVLIPEYNRLTQTLVEISPLQTEEGWVRQWEVRLLPEDEIAKNQQDAYKQASAQVRGNRNELLKQSDWTQVKDAPVDQAAWAAYRQALRDITQQPGFPWEVTWPEAVAL